MVSRCKTTRFRPHRPPIPCTIQISKASLWAACQIELDCGPVEDGKLYAGWVYIDAERKDHLQEERNVELIAPRKKKKYDTLVSEDAASAFVSGVRQPVEIFFNWLNTKTNIQNATHIRSFQGLLLHIYSRLALAMLSLLFNY